jgi:hypothetical protein
MDICQLDHKHGKGVQRRLRRNDSAESRFTNSPQLPLPSEDGFQHAGLARHQLPRFSAIKEQERPTRLQRWAR